MTYRAGSILRIIIALFFILMILFTSSMADNAPKGIKQAMRGAQWRFAVTNHQTYDVVSNLGDNTVIYSLPPDPVHGPPVILENDRLIFNEYDRWNALGIDNAFWMMGNPVFNASHYLTKHNTGLFASKWNDNWLTEDAPTSHSHPGEELWVRIQDVVWRYASERYNGEHTDEGFPESRYYDDYTASCDAMDFIIDGIQDNIMNDPYFRGYMLMNETWGRNDSWSLGVDSEQAFELGRYAINRIRSRDPYHPIIIQHCFLHAMLHSNITGGDLQDVDYVFRSTHPDSGLGGWNIFVNFDHIHKNWLVNGLDYYEHLWQNLHYGHRALSLAIADYKTASASYLKGPEPEWWHCLSLERTLVPTDSSGHTVWGITGVPGASGRRRVTKHEITMETYSALAAGAKGITLWPYLSGDDKYDWIPVIPQQGGIKPKELDSDFEDLPGEYDDYGELDDQPNGFRSKKIFQGLTEPAFCYPWDGQLEDALVSNPDTSVSHPEWRRLRDNVRDFHRPLSQNDNAADPISDTDTNFMPYDEHYNPEFNTYYPFDVIGDMYAELDTLLPILRELRWWWVASDGPTSSPYWFEDTFTDGSDSTFIKASIFHDMENDDFGRFGVTDLSQRFRLVNAGPTDGNYGQFVVGMFGNPKEGDIGEWDGVTEAWRYGPEYYLIVNQECNSGSAQNYSDANASTAVLEFNYFNHDYIDDATVTTVWSGDNDYSYIYDITKEGGDQFPRTMTVEVDIAAGDAILIKVESLPVETITGYTYYNTYNSGQTIHGPKRYTNMVYVTEGATKIFDGHFEFEDNFIINDSSTVIIAPGSTLRFANGKYLRVIDESRLFVQGEADQRVILTSLDDDSRKGWQGIIVDEIGDSTVISSATIEHATIGVAAATSGANHRFFANDVIFQHCELAAYAKMYIATFDSCTIRECTRGAQAFPVANSSTNWTSFRGCTFEGIDDFGVEFNGLYKAYVPSSTFQEIGGPAIVATDVAKLHINEGAALYPGTPVIVRHCCLDAEPTEDAAIMLDNTYVYLFNHAQIYDNGLAGIKTENSSAFTTSTSNNHHILLAGNYDNKKYPNAYPDHYYNPYMGQVIQYDGTELNIPTVVYDDELDLFYDQHYDIHRKTGIFYLTRPDSIYNPLNTMNMRGVCWIQDTDIEVSLLRNDFYPMGASTSDTLLNIINVNPLKDQLTHNEDDYWLFRDVQSLPETNDEWISYALSLIDTQATHEEIVEATELLEDIANEGNETGLKCYIDLLIMQNCSSQEI